MSSTVVSWAGGMLSTVPALFGPSEIQSALHENLVLAVSEPADGCGREGITNAAALSGKIVLIQRGGKGMEGAECTFAEKTANAQNAGAAAVIIYNNIDGTLPDMGDSQSRRLQGTIEDDSYHPGSFSLALPDIYIGNSEGIVPSTCDGVAWSGT